MSAANADDIDYCQFMMNKHAYLEDGAKIKKTLSVANPHSPKAGSVISDDTCEIKALSGYSVSKDKPNLVTGYWVYTGNHLDTSIKKLFVTVTHKVTQDKKKLYADDLNGLCEVISEYAKKDYLEHRTNSWNGDYSIRALSHPYRFASISGVEGEAFKYNSGSFRCTFQYYDDETEKFFTATESFSAPYNFYSDTALDSCATDQVRNETTLECEAKEREEDERCAAGVRDVIEPISVQPLNSININNCHMQKVSSKYASDDLPKTCLSVTYESSGKTASANDYVYRDADFKGCKDFVSKQCLDGFVFNPDDGQCYSFDYETYNPDEIDDGYVPETKEEPSHDAPVREDDSEGQYDTGGTVECEEVGNEFETETLCKIVDESGDTIRDANRAEYPEGSTISQNLCANGMTGNSCDKSTSLGGTSGSADSDLGVDSLNEKLDNLFSSDEQIHIDYDTVGEGVTLESFTGEYGEGGKGSALDLEAMLDEKKGTLLEEAECPQPSVITFLEGVEFNGRIIEQEFEFSYAPVCEFGDKYKSIYLTIFKLMLVINLILVLVTTGSSKK
ncbi:hypothetical protein AB6E06_22825 [Vibrio splendidus]